MKLNLIGLVESTNCTFGQEAAESVEHLLFSYSISSDFWKHVLSWLRDNDVHVGTNNESDEIFGKFDIVEDSIFLLIIYMLFTGWQVRIGRNCAQGLEYLPRPFLSY